MHRFVNKKIIFLFNSNWCLPTGKVNFSYTFYTYLLVFYMYNNIAVCMNNNIYLRILNSFK